MIPEIEELYQEVILDHSRRPRNFGELPDAAVLVHGDNPACGDEIHLAVKFDAGGGLEDIKFTGHGCAISQASASLMTVKLKGKSRPEAMEMLRAFHDLVTNDANEAPKVLGDLRVMRGVRNFPQRVKCAMLPWRAVEQAFEQGAGEATVSTVVERFKDAPAIYQRLREKGRMMPEGLEYVSSWIDVDLKICWQLMRAEDESLFRAWTDSWKDLMDFEIVPVRTSAEVRELIEKQL